MTRKYLSTKTFTHAQGLSCAFRQWRAESHCRFLHGYALQVRIEFESEKLDVRNWVVDFGALKDLKEDIVDMFDHKTLVAQDDPALDDLTMLEQLGLAQVRVVPAVGCEKFAEYIFDMAKIWLFTSQIDNVKVRRVEVAEHAGNSAIVEE